MLRQARDESGLTQQDAAKRAKVTNAYLCQLEHGEGVPSVELLSFLGQIYGTTFEVPPPRE